MISRAFLLWRIRTVYHNLLSAIYFHRGAACRACLIASVRSSVLTSSSDSRCTVISSVGSRCCVVIGSTSVAKKQCVKLLVDPGLPEITIYSCQLPLP